MATLNVKQVPDELYKRLKAQAQREHRSVAQQVIHLLSQAVEPEKNHSLFELAGLGKELWQGLGMDAAEYIRRERDSWD